MNFTDLISDKKVALVGPAAYMVGSKYGDEIDSYDTVIRLNRGIESIHKYGEDVGVKTDILYSCLIEKPANAGYVDPISLKRDYNIKMVVAPPHSDFRGIAYDTRFHELVNMKKVEQMSKFMPVRLVDHNFHTELAKKVSCKPNTGFLAIYDILRYSPQFLSIYGFSFYLDGFIPGCKSGVEQEQNLTEKQFAAKCFVSKRHVQKNMWEYAKETLKNNKQIKLDKYLTKILNLKELDKTLFAEDK